MEADPSVGAVVVGQDPKTRGLVFWEIISVIDSLGDHLSLGVARPEILVAVFVLEARGHFLLQQVPPSSL